MITFSRYVSHLYRYTIKDYQTIDYAYCIGKQHRHTTTTRHPRLDRGSPTIIRHTRLDRASPTIIRHPRLDRGSQLNKHEEVRSLKASFHKSGPLWIYRERSDRNYFLVDNEMQNSLSSRCSRELTAHPTRLCERPARAKSLPTCNFIHHHITLRRQIGIPVTYLLQFANRLQNIGNIFVPYQMIN